MIWGMTSVTSFVVQAVEFSTYANQAAVRRAKSPAQFGNVASFRRVADALYGTENFACKPGGAADFN